MANNENIDEKYLASAVHYLLSTGHADIAKLVLRCELETEYDIDGDLIVNLRGTPEFYHTYMTDIYYEKGPNDDYDVQGQEQDGEFRTAIRSALGAVFGRSYFGIHPSVILLEFDLEWRTRLLAESETKEAVTNQNPWEKNPVIWNGMRFSSPPEVEIAKALEKTGVTYLPNCLVRIGAPSNQQTLFPDFLICYKGKWGILEVDGQTYHNGTATQDYERMRKLIQHVDIFDRYEAKKCMSEPDEVVKTFLNILGDK